MDKIKIIIVILFIGFLIYLIREAVTVRKARAKLTHVVYVNGTRGKSTVTRMIAAGLKAGGHRVLCKTTGTLPIAIYPDGHQEEIVRRAPANIREQIKYLRIAAAEGADVLIIECMALQPEYQRVSARDMLHCDVGVITNARLDHMDVMGDTREEILDCLMEILPAKGLIVTAERDFPEILETRAKKLDSRLLITDENTLGDLPGAAELDFPENVALALGVCESLGVERKAAFEGIRGFVRDPYALSVHEGENTVFVNALSANDVSSTQMIYDRTRGPEDEELVILINNRGDRPARAKDMARLVKVMQPRRVWMLGDNQEALGKLCEKAAPQAEVRGFRVAEEIPFASETPRLILAVGNIKNEGIRLVERAKAELKEKEVSSDVQ
nr:poly-gamma-glutamate synthase PgsB [Lachnospiraceae bacterium]